MSTHTLHLGDCLDVLRTLPDASVDAVVTDPPYGLAFMGKRWDYDVPSVEVWAECLRVLKPGGHLLAFAGTRTQHRMAVRIEDAGFEIRDLIMYCYGSGFPKSHNVGKALGEQACTCGDSALPYTHEEGLSREPQAEREVHSLRHSDVSQALHPGQRRGSLLQPCLQEQGASVNRAMPCKGEQGPRQSSMERRGDAVQEEGQLHRSALRSGAEMGAADGAQGRLRHAAPSGDGADLRVSADSQRGGGSPGPQPEQQSPEQSGSVSQQRGSQAWGGWPVCGGCGKPMVPEGLGTALKPALEPITMARKPLAGTVAACVLQHGTGALNVDGCRVPMNDYDRDEYIPNRCGWKDGAEYSNSKPPRGVVTNMGNGRAARGRILNEDAVTKGRWPANLIHDGSDEVVGLFPAQAGGGFGVSGGDPDGNGIYNRSFPRGDRSVVGFGDTGSAARFFYTAKATKAERQGVTHPTVKPLDLMAYLCRLVTPPGGIVLDPFMGSGTTIKAALSEGFNAIGIERDPAYYAMAQHRMDGAQLGLPLTTL